MNLLSNTIRGFGQLFLCNNRLSGTIFLCALMLMSPQYAILSVVGAVTVTIGAHIFCRKSALRNSGLFGVNGVLLGYLWVLFPELSLPVAFVATLLGSAVLVAILVPVTTWLQRQSSPFTVFTLPAVLVLWSSLGILSLMGQYDLNHYRGWKLFFDTSYGEAESIFKESRVKTGRAQAYAHDARGWIAFHRSHYVEAYQQFRTAIELDNSVGDPLDGAGWSLFKLGDYSGAETMFQNSLKHHPLKGSSWDGAGWCAYYQGNYQDGKHAFTRAILVTPFFSDGYLGLAMCHEALNEPGENWREIHQKLAALNGSPLALLSTLHILGWVLFLIGILIHSRIAAGAVVVAVSIALSIPGSVDINLYYNLAAVAIALTGTYFVLSCSSLVLSVVVSILMVVSWPLWNGIPMPLSCLPFNVILMGVLLFGYPLKGRLGLQTVPLDIAVMGPEKVLWWKRKKALVEKCDSILLQ